MGPIRYVCVRALEAEKPEKKRNVRRLNIRKSMNVSHMEMPSNGIKIAQNTLYVEYGHMMTIAKNSNEFISVYFTFSPESGNKCHS